MDAPITQERLRTWAAWLFTLPVFTEGLGLHVVKLPVAGLAVLAFMVLIRGPVPPLAAERAFTVLAVLSLVVIAYLASGHWPAYQGSPSSYDSHAVIFLVTWTAVAVYGAFFYDERLLEQAVWRTGVAALWLGVITCVFSRLTGHHILVDPDAGALRMVGG